jgi:hypothetical protein
MPQVEVVTLLCKASMIWGGRGIKTVYSMCISVYNIKGHTYPYEYYDDHISFQPSHQVRLSLSPPIIFRSVLQRQLHNVVMHLFCRSHERQGRARAAKVSTVKFQHEGGAESATRCNGV